jgi:hypothetical protein
MHFPGEHAVVSGLTYLTDFMRLPWLPDQELEHVAVLPGSLLPPGTHADLRCPVAADNVERNLAQERQVACRGAIAHAAVVLAERDVNGLIANDKFSDVRRQHLSA